MKSRCKPKRQQGRFMANGQSAKRGLNRSISDASWGELFSKITWLALKSGMAICTCMRYIIAPSSLAGRGLGVGFLYLTQSRTAISQYYPLILNLLLKNVRLVIILVKLIEIAKSSFVKIVDILTEKF
ncbi:transposase, IS605 OrfB family protein [Dolichospermum compactum NIES-806]|uniref:Transposase, IS605 OrfB family protein n=1 Tax=Dolichospermum compactum NIES-806 TaxID=1973481 RepID=A0A1Z4V421_9CYAN|nr:transposase, IS605 OrfB family protein [Dolichospermum compactum NIES-806]